MKTEVGAGIDVGVASILTTLLKQGRTDDAKQFAIENGIDQKLDFEKPVGELLKELESLSSRMNPGITESPVRTDEAGLGFAHSNFRTGVSLYKRDLESSTLSIPQSKFAKIAEFLELTGYVTSKILREQISQRIDDLNGHVFVGEDKIQSYSSNRIIGKCINTWMFTESRIGPVILEIEAYKSNRVNKNASNDNSPRNCHCTINCINPYTGEAIFSYLVYQTFDTRSFKIFESDVYPFNTDNIARRLHETYSADYPNSHFKLNYSERVLQKSLAAWRAEAEDMFDRPINGMSIDDFLNYEFIADRQAAGNAQPDLSRFNQNHVLEIFKRIDWANAVKRLAENDLETLLQRSTQARDESFELSDNKTKVILQKPQEVNIVSGGLRGKSKLT